MSNTEAKPAGAKEGDQRSGLDTGLLKRLLAMAWKYRRGCIVPLLIQLTLLSLGVMGLSLTGLGLDIIIHSVDPTRKQPQFPLGWTPPESWSTIRQLLLVCGVILGFSLIRGILNLSYAVTIAHLIQGRLVVDLRAAVYDKLQRLSFRFYDENQTGSIINRVTTDVQAVSGFMHGIVLQLIVLVLSLAVYLTYMVRLSPKLTLACLATTPVLWYGSFMYSRIMKPQYRKQRELFDRVIVVLAETISGIHVVKGFLLDAVRQKKFEETNMDYRKQQRRIFWGNSIFGPSISYITQINLAILLGYGGWMVINGQLEFGTGLWVFVGLLHNVSGQVQHLAGMTDHIQRSLVAARRVYEVLDAPLEIKSPVSPKRLPRARGSLEFRSVSFEFKPGKPVLRDITFSIEPGQCVGILGPTGAGKSVLLSLIPRFYDPSAGQILVDGTGIREYDLQDLRRASGLVFQESFLFSNTIAANIAFGHPDASYQQIEQAAMVAKAHQFIAPMPKGYDTVLNEGGSNLSGGQKQRLAIARALILEPSFLLMDDPMAAVDAQTEHEMTEAMTSAMAGRTTILVANRISTLRRADLILVMQKGRIVQRGTHEYLMGIPGYYRETARLQLDEEARKAAATAEVLV